MRHFTCVPTIEKKQNKTSNELHATRTLSSMHSNTPSPPFFSSHSHLPSNLLSLPHTSSPHTLPTPPTPYPSPHRSTPQWLAPAPSGQIHHKSCSSSSSDFSFQNSWNPSVTHGTYARILYMYIIFIFNYLLYHFLIEDYFRFLYHLINSYILCDMIWYDFIVHYTVLFYTGRELYY